MVAGALAGLRLEPEPEKPYIKNGIYHSFSRGSWLIPRASQAKPHYFLNYRDRQCAWSRVPEYR